MKRYFYEIRNFFVLPGAALSPRISSLNRDQLKIIAQKIFGLLLVLQVVVNPLPAQTEETERLSDSTSVQWKPLLKQSMFFLGIAHSFRIATEQGTRDELGGPFFRDYFRAVGNLHGWSDGDPFIVNFVGHPMEGAVAGFMFVQNDPRYRKSEFGNSAMYWKSRLRATAFAWTFSTLFEIGPISEASIGNIQSYYPQEGFVDHVMTPAMGMVWMVGEDALDKYVVKYVESRTNNKAARALLRTWLSPSRSFSNLLAFRRPWERDTRPGITVYDAVAWESAQKLGDATSKSFLSSSGQHNESPTVSGGYPRIPSFELAVHYDYFNHGTGGAYSGSCSGGGATGVFQLKSWLGMVIDVSGCKQRTSDPNITGDSLTYLFGPRLSFRKSDRLTFYTDFLLGGNKLTQDHYFPERVPLGDLTEWDKLDAWVRHGITTESTEANGFAMAVGGGLDLKVRKGIGIRLGNFQYLWTTLGEFNDVRYSGMFRFSTGLILRAGDL